MIETFHGITVLVTSIGATGAQGVIKALRRQQRYPVKIVGCDALSDNAGKLLVDAFHHIPHANDARYVSTLQHICALEHIDLLIPMMDPEILTIAQHRGDFQSYHPVTPPLQIIVLCSDKLACQHAVEQIPGIRCPRLFSSLQEATLPAIIKPRVGTGSQGMRIIRKRTEISEEPGEGFIVQEFIHGTEYSVDTYVSADGYFAACVPRQRVAVKNGLSVKTLTIEHPPLIQMSTSVLRALGVTGPANLQFIEDKQGTLYFLEINPRFGGAYIASVEAGLQGPLYLLNELQGDPIEYKGYCRGLLMLRYWEEAYTHTENADALG